MFKKFEMSNDLLQYGLYTSSSILDTLVHCNFNDTSKLSPEDQKNSDIWFGCKNVEMWKSERCPYYRIYPGVFEAILKLDLDKLLSLDVCPFPFGLKTLSIEIPQDYWNLLGCNALIVGNLDGFYGVTLQNASSGYGYNLINLSSVKKDIEGCNEATHIFIKIIFGVLSIGENPDIVKPVVLKADERKYQLTGDMKYVEKAKRRGVFGFDVGEDIPTKAQIKKMVEENELAIQQGRKATHYRCAHLCLVHTGKGGALSKFIVRKGCLVNKDLLIKIPQGFYEE